MEVTVTDASAVQAAPMNNSTSYFDGTVLSYVGYVFFMGIVSSLTFGIAYPWIWCEFYKWKMEHTVVGGRRLKFVGNGTDFFIKGLKWIFFCIITLGIYSFWMGVAIEKWKAERTVFAN